MTDFASIHNLLLDLDGTLTDPHLGITRCIQFALTRMERPVPPPEELLWCIGPPLRHSFSALLDSDDPSLLDIALHHYRQRFATVGLFENEVYPDIPEALAAIRTSGKRLFLATSKPGVFARQILDHFDLSRFFDGVYGSELDGGRVDKTELINHIMHNERLSQQTTLMVGDRKYDIIGGRNNGIATAAVTYGYGNGDELAAVQPDHVFHSPAQMAAGLTQSPEQTEISPTPHHPSSTH